MMFGSFESSRAKSTVSASALPQTTAMRLQTFLKTQCAKFVDKWYSFQLAHYGGKYSIERMLAFEEYVRTTSIDHVLLLTIGVPFIVIGLILCQESIPLQNPADGWEMNYGFWIRAGLVGVTIGNAASIQIGFWLDVPPFTLKQIVIYCLLMGTGYIAAGMLTARLWVFPIPFFMFTLCLVTTLIIIVYIRLVVGAKAFRHILSRHEQLRRLYKVGTVQALLFIIYPAYQVLFTKASSANYELPVLLILPTVRLVLKWVFSSAAAHKEDMIPAQVVFTVDFFDSFYLTTFIQAVSPTTLAVVMIVDFIQTASELYELQQRTQRLLSRLSKALDTTLTSNDDLLSGVRLLFGNPDTHNVLIKNRIQVHSCIFHELSNEGRVILSKIKNRASSESSTSSYQHNLKTISKATLVTPKPGTNSRFKGCLRGKVMDESPPQEQIILQSPKPEDIPAGMGKPKRSRKRLVADTSLSFRRLLKFCLLRSV
ncbi:unnamed protein product [Phytophthora lilii]|uniref:Unnamed protein product n=1 Tax=Phytophthora lilii TaxID=2077276 RepID=A0A9W6U726_9STRA|nr:unnamed protein product [Phytophthora lilii]